MLSLQVGSREMMLSAVDWKIRDPRGSIAAGIREAENSSAGAFIPSGTAQRVT